MDMPAAPLISWDSRFNTGHPQIDAQHKELVDHLNAFAADVEHHGTDHLRLFEIFKKALQAHCAYEEAALRKLGLDESSVAEHAAHHATSMELLEKLGRQLATDPREYSAMVLAEISHCLLVDLLNEDSYYFVSEATKTDVANVPPIAPALHAFGRLVGLLNQHRENAARSRDYYLTLLDDFPTPIFSSDSDGNFDWFNSTWRSLTGMSDEQSRQWIDAIHLDDREVFRRKWQQCREGRSPLTAEYRLPDAAGNWCWMHHVSHPFFDSEGIFLGYISTLFDLTERRRTEASMRVSAEVFEYVREAIMITGANGLIEAVNPAFTEITGYTPQDAIGKSPSFLRSDFHEESYYRGLWDTLIEHGHWQGEIVNRHKNGELFPVWLSISVVRNDAGEILRMVGILSNIASARESSTELLNLAHHDTLTGLPNRLLFNARAQHSLERCKREDSSLAILFIDLDNFKPVNDQLGHRAGDAVLRDVASRLSGVLRNEDTIARFGGDEFVVLVERAAGIDDAMRVAEKVMALFPIVLKTDRSEISIAASIGISIYPDQGQSVDELIDAADQAMYRVKRSKS